MTHPSVPFIVMLHNFSVLSPVIMSIAFAGITHSSSSSNVIVMYDSYLLPSSFSAATYPFMIRSMKGILRHDSSVPSLHCRSDAGLMPPSLFCQWCNWSLMILSMNGIRTFDSSDRSVDCQSDVWLIPPSPYLCVIVRNLLELFHSVVLGGLTHPSSPSTFIGMHDSYLLPSLLLVMQRIVSWFVPSVVLS